MALPEEINRLLPSGTGNVPVANIRQILNDMFGVVNLKQPSFLVNVRDSPFNARADGSDDFPAFAAAQAAINAAGGGILFAPAGIYNSISGSISPQSNTILQGAGIDATIIQNSVQTFPNDQTISIYGTMTGVNTDWPGTNTTYPIDPPTIGDNKVKAT